MQELCQSGRGMKKRFAGWVFRFQTAKKRRQKPRKISATVIRDIETDAGNALAFL
jgi:hypothetical protein